VQGWRGRSVRCTVAECLLQVLFRGVRELKKIQLMTVTRPKVVVECAGVQVASMPIKNINQNSNFPNPVQFADLVRTPHPVSRLQDPRLLPNLETVNISVLYHFKQQRKITVKILKVKLKISIISRNFYYVVFFPMKISSHIVNVDCT